MMDAAGTYGRELREILLAACQFLVYIGLGELLGEMVSKLAPNNAYLM
jgi:hypothetical protein